MTEACSNVLRHAAATDGEYEVEVAIDERKCEIRVTDTGAGFDAGLFGEQAQFTAEGGRGIFLMRALVDDLRFVARPEVGTVVHLEKNLDFDQESVLYRLTSAGA